MWKETFDMPDMKLEMKNGKYVPRVVWTDGKIRLVAVALYPFKGDPSFVFEGRSEDYLGNEAWNQNDDFRGPRLEAVIKALVGQLDYKEKEVAMLKEKVSTLQKEKGCVDCGYVGDPLSAAGQCGDCECPK